MLGAALVVGLPWWVAQMLRHAKYRAGLRQRLGRVPEHVKQVTQPVIWMHAVSVGEVLAVTTLVQRLREAYPSHRVFISTTTATGNELARQRFGSDNVFFFPLDFAFAIRPYLRALRPELVILAETEFWPNFLRLISKSGARIAVVNARISDRSFPRYRRYRALLRRVLRPVQLFLAQSDEDARRLVEIGAEKERVCVAGNLKFEVSATAEVPAVAALRSAIGSAGPVLVCGSTVEGEEPMVLDAFRRVLAKFPRAILLLAPRHRERFDTVAELLTASGLPALRRSRWQGKAIAPGSVLLLDSLGELASVYALADIAFVGGSLVSRGGHNVLEPAQHGCPIVVGPHTENFRDTIAIFRHADAIRITAPESFAQMLIDLLQDNATREALGHRAAEVVRTQSGATERTLQGIAEVMAGAR